MITAITAITMYSAASRLPSASAGVSGKSSARIAEIVAAQAISDRDLVGGQMPERLVVAVVEAEQLGDEQPQRQERERPRAADRYADRSGGDSRTDQVGERKHATATRIAPPAATATEPPDCVVGRPLDQLGSCEADSAGGTRDHGPRSRLIHGAASGWIEPRPSENQDRPPASGAHRHRSRRAAIGRGPPSPARAPSAASFVARVA